MVLGWRRQWLALICVTASIPALGALPCKPGAFCALQMAREAVFREAANANDDEKMSAALHLLQWVGEQDQVSDPAVLKPKFTALRSRLDRWPTPAKVIHLASFAMALGSAGLIPEARALIDIYPVQMQGAMIEASCASFYARRNRLDEAFAAAKAAGTPEMIEAVNAGILQTLASSGRPELTLAAGRRARLDGEQVKSSVAIAHLNSGNDVAARQEAMSIADPMMRKATIGLIMLRCQELGTACKVIPIARVWLDQVRNSQGGRFTPDGMAKETAIKILVERLTEVGDLAGVLALIAEMDADRRAAPLMAAAPKLRREADIQTAEQLGEGLLRMDREVVADALNISRVRLGKMNAAAALKSSTRPRATSNHLIQLAREIGPADATKAREVLQVAITGDSRIKDPDWNEIIAVQLDLGWFTDAEQTMQRHQPAATDRTMSLLRMSVAYAMRGQKEKAATYRAQALASAHSKGPLAHEPASLALEWLRRDGLEGAESELRSLIARRVPAKALKPAAELLTSKLVARGDVPRALDFATVWSAYQGGNSKPFTDIYSQAVHVSAPQ